MILVWAEQKLALKEKGKFSLHLCPRKTLLLLLEKIQLAVSVASLLGEITVKTNHGVSVLRDSRQATFTAATPYIHWSPPPPAP